MKTVSIILLNTIGTVLPRSNMRVIGNLGKVFRRLCAKNITDSLGREVNIERGASYLVGTSIGDYSGVGVNCQLSQGVTIGKYVMMGPECLFYTRNHLFSKDEKKYLGHTDILPIVVEDDVWIGARVIVLPGVKIGRGSTVGAGSVVTKDVPPYSVVVGNPARVVKSLI